MEKNKIFIVILICLFLLLPINVFADPSYGKVGADTNFNGDVGVPEGSGYYINGVLLSILENVVEDTTPQLGGDLDCQNKSITATQTVRFNGLYDNGNSGASVTIDWAKGQYQKVTVSENTLISFSNAFVGTLTLNINYSGNFTVGFNAGYTIQEEDGIEIVFTETNGAFDILKVYYYGTANTYVVGALLDVKD